MPIYQTLSIFWLYVILTVLDCNYALMEELERKLCPPKENVNQPVNRKDTAERINKLREEMHAARNGAPLNAYIVTHYDEHLNEYVADRDKRLEYITGYSGNYGLAVITKNKLLFWTDELHHIQANNELSCNWTLFKTDISSDITTASATWLLNEFNSGTRIGTDAKLMPNTDWETIARIFNVIHKSIILVHTSNNYIDAIWPENERPATTNSVAHVWSIEYAGIPWKDKLKSLREHMKVIDVDAMVITSLSEIAWLLNIRASDLPFEPFLKAYCIVTKDQLHLFTMETLPKTLQQHLNTESCVSASCTRLNNYNATWTEVRRMSAPWKKILLPSKNHYSPGVSRHIYTSISQEKRKALPSPLIKMMAEKNDVEKRGMKNAHIRDAVIFCNFSAFLVYEMQRSSESWDELYLANLIHEFRMNAPIIWGPSYPTTVATGPNTGTPMYVPTNETSIVVKRDELLIIDSGFHYQDGTTALARTFRLDVASITDRDIRVYTSLLMGIINLASSSFPPHLTTSQLDIIARTSVWEMGYDYPHGSGHGIGVFSTLHESPVDMNYRNGMNDTLRAGYFLLVETGLYEEENFGMKLSCVFEVVYKNDTSGYLSFEPVTLFPFEHRMINYTLLSVQQKDWLNDYNDKIRTIVGGELQKRGLNNGFNWVVDRTDPIQLVQEQEDNGATLSSSQSILKCLLLLASSFYIKYLIGILV